MPQSPTMNPPRKVSKLPPRRSFLARTWLFWLFLLLLAGGGGAYYYYNYATVKTAEVAYVKRGTALTSVYGTVNVDPVEQIIVRTRNYGQLSAWKIKLGEAVTKNQILAELADDTMQRQLDSAQQNLAQAKVRQSLGPPSNGALKNAEIDLEKTEKLVKAGNLAQIELDKATIAVKDLRDKVQNEQLTLDNDVDTMQRLLDALQAQVKQNQLVAPIDGVILNIYANPGEFLPPQTQLCRIGSAANQIVANVNEEDIGDLKPGMKAQIRLYAYPDKNLEGTLLTVGTSPVNQAYPVSFRLDDAKQKLLPGMTGEMNVIIGEKKNALTIPTRAIRRGNTVSTVVDGVVKQVHVNVGFHTLETSEITEGLEEGMAVILSNQDLYRPGMRVRELNAKEN